MAGARSHRKRCSQDNFGGIGNTGRPSPAREFTVLRRVRTPIHRSELSQAWVYGTAARRARLAGSPSVRGTVRLAPSGGLNLLLGHGTVASANKIRLVGQACKTRPRSGKEGEESWESRGLRTYDSARQCSALVGSIHKVRKFAFAIVVVATAAPTG